MRVLLDNKPVGAADPDPHRAGVGCRSRPKPWPFAAADDEVVIETARQDDRILISADTDFGALLATSHAAKPSVVLVRRVSDRRVEDLAAILLANLPNLEDDLAKGAIVAIGAENIRVRSLPIG